MQGAYLRDAQMQGANLAQAQMQGAKLLGAQMQGAGLRGAGLWQVEFDETSNLSLADLRGIDSKQIAEEDLEKSLEARSFDRVKEALRLRLCPQVWPKVTVEPDMPALVDARNHPCFANVEEHLTTDEKTYDAILAGYLADLARGDADIHLASSDASCHSGVDSMTRTGRNGRAPCGSGAPAAGGRERGRLQARPFPRESEEAGRACREGARAASLIFIASLRERARRSTAKIGARAVDCFALR